MVTGLQLLTLWAQRPTILHIMQTFIGYSPVFTGIVQKVPEIYLSGTSLFVLNELSKTPFEPMKDTDLKHLTLRTAFLLACPPANAAAKSMPGSQTKYLI